MLRLVANTARTLGLTDAEYDAWQRLERILADSGFDAAALTDVEAVLYARLAGQIDARAAVDAEAARNLPDCPACGYPWAVIAVCRVCRPFGDRLPLWRRANALQRLGPRHSA